VCAAHVASVDIVWADDHAQRHGSQSPGCGYQPHRGVWDRLSHAQGLENIVDRLDEKVANEREAERVPAKPCDGEQAATRGSEEEPPE
jgi:hypothetical protein